MGLGSSTARPEPKLRRSSCISTMDGWLCTMLAMVEMGEEAVDISDEVEEAVLRRKEVRSARGKREEMELNLVECILAVGLVSKT